MQCTLLYTGHLVDHIVMVFSSFYTFNSLSSLPPLYELSSCCLSFCTILFGCWKNSGVFCIFFLLSNWTKDLIFLPWLWFIFVLQTDISVKSLKQYPYIYKYTAEQHEIEWKSEHQNYVFFFHFISRSIFPCMH